jgi:WD40 repeat protein
MQAVAFTHDGHFVVSGSRDKTLRAWNADTGQQVLTLTLDGAIFSVKVSPDGRLLACGDGNVIDLWKVGTN